MKGILTNNDFLLYNETAKELYHETAAKLPIIDYHCHINPAEVAKNIGFSNITEGWLYGDHYKWRAMRACGVSEKYITGDSSDKEKYLAFAGCMPKLIGNPLYHWNHLELKKYCGIDTALSPETAEEIWEKSEAALKQLKVRDIIRQSNVETICSTDDPADSLEFHKAIRQDSSFETNVLPAFRPDRAISIEKPDFAEYITRLGNAAEMSINSFSDLLTALSKRMDHFAELGCRASDHGVMEFPYNPGKSAAESAFTAALSGKTPDDCQIAAFKTELLLFLAGEYNKREWVMEIHYGVLRNTNELMFGKLGPDTGFDNMGQYSCIPELTRFLSHLNSTGALPKTLIFSINPNDNGPIATLCGAFGDRVQPGCAWWFNDTLVGMRNQLDEYASLLPLGKFLGFLTDSRSFLSYTRHEYFRRLLCGWIGERVELGEFPADMDNLKKLVADICYNNVKEFFGY